MKREERLYLALVNIAENADHVAHAYLICGKCKAIRALEIDAEIKAKRKAGK